MRLSSESLFHFTPKLEFVKLIICNGFKYSNCIEELPGIGFSESLDKLIKSNQAVCFCDIPLSLTQSHRAQYGKYIFAMKKDWAIDKGVTPIRYLHQNSPDIKKYFLRRIVEIYEGINKSEGGIIEFYSNYLKEIGYDDYPNFPDDFDSLTEKQISIIKRIQDDYESIAEAYFSLIGLSRIYQGEWTDRGNNVTSVRCFYDEREWRALTLIQNNFLKFQLSDINYILVDSDDEKDLLIEELIKEQNVREMQFEFCKEEISKIVFVSNKLLNDL